MPPNHLLEHGKQVPEFFNASPDPYNGGRSFRFKPMEQYSKEHGTNEQPSKQYFKATTLPEIIRTYAFSKKTAKQADIDRGASFFSSSSPLPRELPFRELKFLSFGLCRDGDAVLVHRLLLGSAQHRPYQAVVALASSSTPVHHWREVHRAV